LKTTPAGSQINSDWAQLGEAIDCMAVFLAGLPLAAGPAETHVIFRCGTVARVREGDPEFGGYEASEYQFPEHDLAGRLEDGAVADIMADNARVWAAQRGFPEPVGRAVRRAYAALVAPGYPYPGGPTADRRVAPTGISSEAEGTLAHVLWPHLDVGGRVYNLAFMRNSLVSAAVAGGDCRRYDYLFPEVAAVFMPDRARWTYHAAADGGPQQFACR
jgi:hypothetical protein